MKKAKGVHFYKAKGYGEKAAFWLRPYHPPAEVARRRVSVLAVAPGACSSTGTSGSMTRRIKQLHQAVPEAYVELNRADADELGIKKGDRVKLVSRRGELELAGRGRRTRPPAARHACSCRSSTSRSSINLLTLDAMDNISKQPDYKKCAVRLERV